jgi:hypothetical protein
MAGLRGAGKVYLSVLSGGAYGGYLDMANIASFTLGNDGGDTVTLKSTSPANYGAVIGSSTTPGDDTISIALNVPNRKNLTTMLLGTDSTVTNTGAAVTNEAITVLAKGTYIPLAKRKLDTNAAPVVTNTAGTTTYTVTTDYVIDYDNGLIYITPASTIAVGTIHVDYTHLDYTGYSINARTTSSINCKMLFTGENLDSGEIIRVTADSVELSPEGDFSLISADGEFLEFTLSGTIKVPTGQTVPFVMEVIA